MDQILVSTPNGLYAVDAETGNISHHLEDSNSSVIAPVGSVNVGSRVICAAQATKGLLHFWRIHEGSGAPEGTGNPHYKCAVAEKFSALTFSPCGGLMIAGTASGTVSIWQTWSGKLLKSWVCHFGVVTGLVVSSGMLFTCGSDAAVKGFFLPSIWAQVVPNPVIIVSGHGKGIVSMVLNEVAGVLVVASEDPVVKVYDLKKELKKGFLKSTGPVALSEMHAFSPSAVPSHVCVSNDAKQVIVGCVDGSVVVVDRLSPQSDMSVLCHINEPITGMGITLDNGRLAVVGSTSGLRIVDIETGTVAHTVMGPSQQMKGAIGLLVMRKAPVLPVTNFGQNISLPTTPWMEPNRLVSAIDSYLQFKPLQRTITPIESIEKIPLIYTLLKHAKTKVRSNTAFCVDSTCIEKESGADTVGNLQLEVAKQRELAKVWSRAFMDLYTRAKAAVPELEFRIDVPRSEEELTQAIGKKQKRR